MSARTLFALAPNPNDASVAQWYADTVNQRLMVAAVNLIVIGSIAFLWFVAVIRRRAGIRENRFFGTVFLGSALLSAGAWMIGGLLFTVPALDAYLFGSVQGAAQVSPWQAAGLATATILAVRLEAVFIISTTTVARLSEAFPRALLLLGYGAGLLLMVAPVPEEALAWIFPAWMAVVSCALLVRRHHVENEIGTELESSG